MSSYQFPCGCTWPLLEENPPPDVVPLIDLDTDRAPEDCPATWALLGRGQCKGIFQLESGLGRTWTKKLRPENLEHIAALGAILRPGALKGVDQDGVSMTQHYVLRKNGLEPLRDYLPVVDAILFPTYGVIAYQEQAMALCVAVAGFNEQEADVVRKAIGKKLPEEMAKVKKMFAEGAARLGLVTTEQAEEIFGWIEKSQRYSFNKAHAACYGVTGYHTAYIKAHCPLAFFTGWLLNAKHKNSGGGPQEEMYELINDAKLFNIEVQPPDLRSLENDFHTDRKVVKFGLGNIKSVGPAKAAQLKAAVLKTEQETSSPVAAWDWWSFLLQCSPKLDYGTNVRLIQSGALSWFGRSRALMEAEFKAWDGLTKKEQEWMIENQAFYTELVPALRSLGKPKKEGGGAANKNRVSIIQSHADLLENPGSPLQDTPTSVAFCEEDLLGISITHHHVESCDMSEVNCTCKEFAAGRDGFILLGVQVEQVKQLKTKSGKTPGTKYGRMMLGDGTCSLEAVAWGDEWKQFHGLLVEGNTVVVQAERDFRDKQSTQIKIRKVWQAVNRAE